MPAKPTFRSNDARCPLHFEPVFSRPSVHAKDKAYQFCTERLSLNLVSPWSEPEKDKICAGSDDAKVLSTANAFTRNKQGNVTPLPPREAWCRLNLVDLSVPPNDRGLPFVCLRSTDNHNFLERCLQESNNKNQPWPREGHTARPSCKNVRHSVSTTHINNRTASDSINARTSAALGFQRWCCAAAVPSLHNQAPRKHKHAEMTQYKRYLRHLAWNLQSTPNPKWRRLHEIPCEEVAHIESMESQHCLGHRQSPPRPPLVRSHLPLQLGLALQREALPIVQSESPNPHHRRWASSPLSGAGGAAGNAATRRFNTAGARRALPSVSSKRSTQTAAVVRASTGARDFTNNLWNAALLPLGND